MRAFASGSRGELLIDADFRAGPSAWYGVHPTLVKTWQNMLRAGGDYWYVDNGYLGRDYFRVTKNLLQHSGIGRPDFARLKRIGVQIKPWTNTGSHILLCPHTDYFHDLMLGDTARQWVDSVIKQIQTERQIRIRHKSDPKPLQADLADCWCVVTPQSNCAVEAILAGVPAFVTGQSAALPMSSGQLDIENPVRPDGRMEWAGVLAANQWTLSEIESGVAWRNMR